MRIWAVVVIGSLGALAACSSGPKVASSTSAPPTSVSLPPPGTLTVLVTNDDGVSAPGINALVQGLRRLPHTDVTVVAPSTNRSGTGAATSSGAVVAIRSKTAAGYPAWAVLGYPADTITWAIDDHGIPLHPDLVVSGINFGENIGPLAAVSGTVGAAQAALQRGIPALAASQGLDDNQSPDFAEGVKQVDAWVKQHRAALVSHSYGAALPQGNLNIPTCANGDVRGPVTAPLATSLAGLDLSTVDCSATSTSFTDDAQAFVLGYAVIAPLSSSK